jgi:hypothetical protein
MPSTSVKCSQLFRLEAFEIQLHVLKVADEANAIRHYQSKHGRFYAFKELPFGTPP